MTPTVVEELQSILRESSTVGEVQPGRNYLAVIHPAHASRAAIDALRESFDRVGANLIVFKSIGQIQLFEVEVDAGKLKDTRDGLCHNYDVEFGGEGCRKPIDHIGNCGPEIRGSE